MNKIIMIDESLTGDKLMLIAYSRLKQLGLEPIFYRSVKEMLDFESSRQNEEEGK